MVLTFGFKTPRDLYEKLKRDAAILDSATDLIQQDDAIFNFVITAFHITDWIKFGPAQSSPEMLKDLEALKKEHSIRLCEDLCNASKHFIITRNKSKLSDTIPYDARVGTAVVGSSRVDQKLPDLDIVDGGNTYSFRDLRDKVMVRYETFFQDHNL